MTTQGIHVGLMLRPSGIQEALAGYIRRPDDTPTHHKEELLTLILSKSCENCLGPWIKGEGLPSGGRSSFFIQSYS